ncbi:replication protein A [Pseudomonas sp. MWU12-2115]|uniref:replication initiation protein n=1 Tax=unclassified Pseudomonas TaxID=196821 RepID=UPI000CD57B30|nr:replication initiation protein [Pseudomonas sp. MWU12-2020]RBB97338.1 replication protein A [Pseudomonas sp. MWU12-2115]
MELTLKAGSVSDLDRNTRHNGKSAATYSPSDRFFESDTALNRVLQEAPFYPRCSDDKTAALTRPRELALRYPYMQINRPGMVSWLIFDLDHTNSLAWDDAGLPAPNLVVRNRNNGHSHLYYAIAPVCTTENARAKPIKYMKAVYAAFAARLNADKDYNSGPVAKTPGHPWWATTEFHNHVYDLGELADCVELTVTPWRKVPQIDEIPDSRHCILFEQLRYFAYSIVNRERDRGSYLSFTAALEAFAYNHNNFISHGFSQNLLLSSLRATVKSVARWTWEKYQGDSTCHRGVMQLDKNLPLEERQRLAAKRTHALRDKATESKIRAACRHLQAKGEKLRQAAIAAIAGVTRQTVASYRHILKEADGSAVVAVLDVGTDRATPKQGPDSAPRLEAASAAAKNVNYGVHQVPAPCLKGIGQCFEKKEDERPSSSPGSDRHTDASSPKPDTAGT